MSWLQGTFPHWKAGGIIWEDYKHVKVWAQDRANETQARVTIMQKDDAQSPAFVLEKIYPEKG